MQTTIESNLKGKYDVGLRGNWEQVFGPNPWLWFIPVYGTGPVGDGLSWPVNAAAAESETLLPSRDEQQNDNQV